MKNKFSQKSISYFSNILPLSILRLSKVINCSSGIHSTLQKSNRKMATELATYSTEDHDQDQDGHSTAKPAGSAHKRTYQACVSFFQLPKSLSFF